MNKNEVREKFPTVTAFADECRAAFGDGVKLTYACENGHEIGKKQIHDPDRVYRLTDDDFVKLEKGKK